MDLSARYMGLDLRTPLVPSASPLSEDVGNIKRMEDAGASAVVLHSLFEEQIKAESRELEHHLAFHTESFAEALTYFPQREDYRVGPEEYLDHIRKAKESVKIPVIGSLNGTSIGSWIKYAKEIEQAGADALELNIYYIPIDTKLLPSQVEKSYHEILTSVLSAVTIPVAVKLSPFFSSMAHMAKQLDALGAKGLVLFNRFYQPDFDIEKLEVVPGLTLSTSAALRVPLRWIAILRGQLKADLAASGGIHSAADVVKVLMAGASAAMLCSSLLKNGIGHIGKIEEDLKKWMEEHEYASVKQMQGSMSLKNCGDPTAFERAQYIKSLNSYKAFDII